MTDIDAEVEAVRRIYDLLTPFEHAAQERVMDWIKARLRDDATRAAIAPEPRRSRKLR